MNLLPYIMMTVLAHNNGHPMIPLDRVAVDYFGLTPQKFSRKLASGEIDLPVMTMEDRNRKSQRGVLVPQLAEYLFQRGEEASRNSRKRAA